MLANANITLPGSLTWWCEIGLLYSVITSLLISLLSFKTLEVHVADSLEEKLNRGQTSIFNQTINT